MEGDTAPGDLYLQILWDKGRTEPGSSGSPLFSSPGVIVAGLTYGEVSNTLSACQIDPSIDGYYRFSNAYTPLKDYLEDLPSAEVMPAASSLSFAVTNHAAAPSQTVQLTTGSADQAAYKLRADAGWILLPTASGTVSAGAPAKVAVAVDASQLTQPGEYDGTITILSGAAAPQYIDVTVQVQSIQSNVAVSISPNPVYQSGGQWSFTIGMTESGGAGTRITALKINGVDYSSAIASWFGANYLPANGSLAAPLSGSGPFVPGTQFFEFWGQDDSGQAWYREATSASSSATPRPSNTVCAHWLSVDRGLFSDSLSLAFRSQRWEAVSERFRMLDSNGWTEKICAIRCGTRIPPQPNSRKRGIPSPLAVRLPKAWDILRSGWIRFHLLQSKHSPVFPTCRLL